MLEIGALVKQIGGRPVLKGIEATIRAGDGFILVGSNGSGKTTLMRLIVGLARPDAGTIRIDGIDAAARPIDARRRLSYLPQRPSFPATLTVREVVAVAAKLRGARPAIVDRELALCGLVRVADRPVTRLSGGERQRVGLAVTFVADVPLYLFDEPSASLDPAATALVTSRARALCAEGRTVLLTTHVAADVGVATRIGILRAGRVDEVDCAAFADAFRRASEGQRALHALVGEDDAHVAPEVVAGRADLPARCRGGLWERLARPSVGPAGSR